MLITSRTLDGYKLHGIDGDIGEVKEFYFDDHHWTIRYLVADTGTWLADRLVLISPYALISVNKKEGFISVSLTKAQIENSPSWKSDKPVSRQFEESYHGYYGWPMYWDGPLMWGQSPIIDRALEKKANAGGKPWDPELRSTFAVSSYDIEASDGPIGHVDNFIIDDDTWAIRYLVVDVGKWLPGKKVLISPLWIERVSWRESKVFVNVLRETVKQAPEYSEADLLTRNYEIGLHQHYDRRGYWDQEAQAEEDCFQ
jgi:hypothetical protein